MATKIINFHTTSQTGEDETTQNATTTPENLTQPAAVKRHVSLCTTDPTIISFVGEFSEVECLPGELSIDEGRWILKPDSRSQGSNESLSEQRVPGDGTKHNLRNRPRAAKPRVNPKCVLSCNSEAEFEDRTAGKATISHKHDTVAKNTIAYVTNGTKSTSPSSTLPFVKNNPLTVFNFQNANCPIKMLPDNSLLQTKPRVKTLLTHPTNSVTERLKDGRKANEKRSTVSQKPQYETSASKLRSSVLPSSERKENSDGSKEFTPSSFAHRSLSESEKQKKLSVRMNDYKKSIEADEPRNSADCKKTQTIVKPSREEKGPISGNDELIKIYESKSKIRHSLIASWVAVPPSSEKIVPTESPTLANASTSAREQRPWTPKPVLDAWVPPKTTFPSWITPEEQIKISKEIKKEYKYSCIPCRKPNHDAPNCCLVKKLESKTNFGIKGNSNNPLRPEVRRWLLGYPQKTRFLRETQDLIRNSPPSVVAHRDDENERHLYVDLKGPANSPYSDGVFRIEIFFPGLYPKEPPRLRFVTKIYHPCVDKLGRIRLSEIEEAWRSSLLLRDVLDALGKLLSEPNISDYIAVDVARRWYCEKALARKTAELWTKKYAQRHTAAAWLDCHCHCYCEPLAAAYTFY